MGAGFSKVRWRRGRGSFRASETTSLSARVYSRRVDCASAAHAFRQPEPGYPVKPEDNAEGECPFGTEPLEIRWARPLQIVAWPPRVTLPELCSVREDNKISQVAQTICNALNHAWLGWERRPTRLSRTPINRRFLRLGRGRHWWTISWNSSLSLPQA